MTDSDRDVLRTIIREELHAVLGELETARVRRSAALEELVLNEGSTFKVVHGSDGYPMVRLAVGAAGPV